MVLLRSVAGMVEVELTSAGPEDAFAAISAENIEILDLRKLSELTYVFLIPRRCCKTVTELCVKRGDVLKIRRRIGLYWTAKKALAQPLLLTGTLLLMALALWVPSRVFFVQVEGNSQIPARRILAAAEECGISFGASRREVRSEKVKNAVLSAVPELQWAGVNTSGCVATISVREKTETEKQNVPKSAASILAARDGYVLSCTATAGKLMVKPGDAVQKGQVLISAYTDCGLCIRAEQAEGEIMAQTSHVVESVMPSLYIKKGETGQVKRKFSLLLRKKRIFLWKDSGIWEGSCGRMYEEYYVTLPGEFQLPIALCVESYCFCETGMEEQPAEEVEAELDTFTQAYLLQHMVAGRILSSNQTVTEEEGFCRMQGEYACVEMIGMVRQEQIGDTNGENS